MTAERLKIERGYAGRPPGREPYAVAGTDIAAQRPARRIVDETLVGEAMADGIDHIARACWTILESTPPDLASDLIETGITLDRRRFAHRRTRRRVECANECADHGR